MDKQIAKIYKKREDAYKILLECDIAIDKILIAKEEDVWGKANKILRNEINI